ncbi:hypothetical protein D3C71_1515690 [compost metagenome]
MPPTLVVAWTQEAQFQLPANLVLPYQMPIQSPPISVMHNHVQVHILRQAYRRLSCRDPKDRKYPSLTLRTWKTTGMYRTTLPARPLPRPPRSFELFAQTEEATCQLH